MVNILKSILDAQGKFLYKYVVEREIWQRGLVGVASINVSLSWVR